MPRTTRSANFARPSRLLACLALCACVMNPLVVLAQAGSGEELLKPGDRVSLSVPGRPALDQDFDLDASGMADIEPVGTVKLGGLSPSEATLLLKQKLRLFYPTLDALDITVGNNDMIRIYIIGNVSQKGVLSFDSEPTIWQVLRAAGGPFDKANMREARIIRDLKGEPEVHPLDLTGVLDGTKFVDFALRNGDTLVIPSLQEGIPGTPSREGVKVFGGVAKPTIVPIDEGTPLLDVLMLAGAPTPDAKRKEINWVHETAGVAEAVVVDLDSYLLLGDPAGNPTVYPGDTIHVKFEKPGWVRQNVPFILGSVAAIATIVLAYDNVVNRSNN